MDEVKRLVLIAPFIFDVVDYEFQIWWHTILVSVQQSLATSMNEQCGLSGTQIISQNLAMSMDVGQTDCKD